MGFWQFDYAEPKPTDIVLDEVAHSLAQQCRYNGCTLVHYSVAEHCVRISRLVEKHGTQAALWGLLHDAAEAYIGDVIRPVRELILGFDLIEERILKAVATRFHLDWPAPEEVWIADNMIIHAEVRDLFDDVVPTDRVAPLAVDYATIEPWSAQEAKNLFLARFVELDLRRKVEEKFS